MVEELSEISKFVSSYWNYYLELEEAFKQTQKYVAFDRHNDRTYSVEYLKLIQAVCSEIDVVAKEIAEHFNPNFSTIQRPTLLTVMLSNHGTNSDTPSIQIKTEI